MADEGAIPVTFRPAAVRTSLFPSLVSPVSATCASQQLEDSELSLLGEMLEKELFSTEIVTAQMLKNSFTVQYILQRYFQVEARTFREGQAEAIAAILMWKSTLALFPTGWGKSLVYQLSAVINKLVRRSPGTATRSRSGVTLVVTPLLSLIQDQVLKVSRLEGLIRPASLKSGLSVEEQKATCNKIAQGEVDVVFVSPERVVGNAMFRDLVERLHRNNMLSCVCIDEAHCISEWSHNFRPCYLYLRRTLNSICDGKLNCPIVGLTATASEGTRQEIIRSLGISTVVEITQHDTKINFQSTHLPKNATRKELLDALNKCVSGASTPMLIYVPTQIEADEIAKHIRASTLRTMEGKQPVVRAYHAGLSTGERNQTQRQFIRDEVDILVATVAFGMGIDKPNIRSVIHISSPPSLEAYVQETGRAGRDGHPALCHVIFNPSEFFTLRRRLLAPLLTFDQLSSVVESILYAPYCVTGKRVALVNSDQIAASSGCASESVETILFQIAYFHPDLVTIESNSPMRCRIHMFSAESYQRPKRKRNTEFGSVCDVLQQLGVEDPVKSFCMANKVVSNIVAAANALNMPLDDLLSRLEDLEASNVLRIAWLQRGYRLALSPHLNAGHIPLLVKEMFQRHMKRFEREILRLRWVFHLLGNPSKEELVKSMCGSQSDIEGLWLPPEPSMSKEMALTIISDFCSKERSRLNGSTEAARALCGVSSVSASARVANNAGNSALPVIGGWWRSHTHFGKLAEFEFRWVEKLCGLELEKYAEGDRC